MTERQKMSVLNKLTARKVSGNLNTGRHSDGGGLYLTVSKTNAKSWVFMWKREGRRREIGLGSLISVPLATARQKAGKCREVVAEGGDPQETLRNQKLVTFKQVATEYMEAKVYDRVHRANVLQWERLINITSREILNRDIATLNTNDILKILSPLWILKPETARKSRARLENVFDYAKGRSWRSGENPARWKGNLSALLVAHDRTKVRHHPAMPIVEMPVFIEKLQSREGVAAKALEFLILTATRTSETLLATSREFDLENKLWVIPAERMKNRKPHTIPLSTQALEIVTSFIELSPGPFIFPGANMHRPLSNMAMGNVLKRMHISTSIAVPHGFRSTFRDWVGEHTSFPRELAERALSHSIGNSTERAYRRSEAIKKRRVLMQSWANYCHASEPPQIVKLHA